MRSTPVVAPLFGFAVFGLTQRYDRLEVVNTRRVGKQLLTYRARRNRQVVYPSNYVN